MSPELLVTYIRTQYNILASCLIKLECRGKLKSCTVITVKVSCFTENINFMHKIVCHLIAFLVEDVA